MDPNVYSAIAAGLAVISVFSVIKVIRIFLRHIEQSDVRQEKFLSNHMGSNVRAQEANTRATEEMARRLQGLEEVVRTAPAVKVFKAEEVEVKP
jgi:hypothetical protein